MSRELVPPAPVAPLPPRRWSADPDEIPLDREEVRRYLGFRPGLTQSNPRAEAAVDEGIALARRLLRPGAVTVECALAGLSRDEVALALGPRWRSRGLAAHLTGATAVTLLAATVGPEVEATVAALFAAGEYPVAVSLDAAASVAVHGWAVRLQGRLLELITGAPPVGRQGAPAAPKAGGAFALTGPFSPGYGDWEVAAQSEILSLVGAADIGLRANAAHYLMPQKSIVAVLGWVPGGPGVRPPLGCAACRLRDCRYRRE